MDEEGNLLMDQNGKPQLKIPNPRVELPYTYLMAYYIMHCPSLMIAVPALEGFVPFVQRLEDSNWIHYCMFSIRTTILSGTNYQLAMCFPEIHDASYGDRFLDFAGSDGFTTLSSGIFWWLINIRPEYLIFRQGNACTIEPYTPSRFARKFGYDQLNIRNPKIEPSLQRKPVQGCTNMVLQLSRRDMGHLQSPSESRNSYMSLSFYT